MVTVGGRRFKPRVEEFAHTGKKICTIRRADESLGKEGAGGQPKVMFSQPTIWTCGSLLLSEWQVICRCGNGRVGRRIWPG